VGNMVRRILRLVREAYAECAQSDLSTKETERGAVDPILSLHVSWALVVEKSEPCFCVLFFVLSSLRDAPSPARTP
jgi:hypothetical protein